jgi:sec-independent protein translocase protein TatA
MELVIILLIVVLLFGGRKIPEIARGLGKGIRDFKGALGGNSDAADADGKALKKPDDGGEGAPKA